MSRLIRCRQCPRCGSGSYRKVRADAVVSLLKVRECRKCSQQYKPPLPAWIAVAMILVGLAMMVWLGLRIKQVGLDRYQHTQQPVPIVLAFFGGLLTLWGLYKLIFQRGVAPPQRVDWRQRREPLPPAAPVGSSVVAIAPVDQGVQAAYEASPRPAAMSSPVAASAVVGGTAPRLSPSQAGSTAVLTAPPPVARAHVQVHGVPMPTAPVLAALRRGVAIPAHPLALNAGREFNERRMRALTRYYLAAGAGGIAAAVHTTQFAIRKPKYNLLSPVLTAVAEEMRLHEERTSQPLVKIAGVCGPTRQAVAEAELAASLGYDIAMVDLSALPAEANDFELVDHIKQVGKVIAVMGFYLQPAVGGRVLPFSFWRALADVPNLVAIKIAAFDRYKTVEVMRAVAEAGRALTPGSLGSAASGTVGEGEHPVAIYTGNDDNILADLMGEWQFNVNGQMVTQRMVGGLLGHWAVWTRAAVTAFERLRQLNEAGAIPGDVLSLGRQMTDMNAAVFDAHNNFRGCIAGVNEVLHRQGLLEGNFCLEKDDLLSPGQAEEITRVTQAYPHLTDDLFIAEHRDEWFR